MKLHELIKENIKKRNELIKQDIIFTDEILGPDKNLPNILKDFLYSNEKFDFSIINNVENCFFETELFKFNKVKHGIEKDLFGRWDFRTSLYHNFNYHLMGFDYRIEVSRKETEIQNKSILNDLRKLGLKGAVVIDLEFFEFPQWDKQFDISRKINQIDLNQKNTELRDYLKDNLLHVEKEKIHLKIIKCNDINGKKIYLPLYIGLGTNEPFGLAIKKEGNKSRWYKLSLDSDVPYIEKGEIKTLNHSDDNIRNIILDSDLIGNDNSWDQKSKTMIATAINKNHQNTEDSDNNLLKGYIKFNYIIIDNEISIGKPISSLEPYYDKKDVVRMDIWKKYINTKDIFSEINELLKKPQEQYEVFFELFNCPYRIISNIGTKKVVDLIGRKYKKILTSQDFSMLSDCVKHGNVNTIAGDLYKLGIDSSRNKVSSLLIQLLIETGRFEQHLDGNFTV
ncbi:hypothetical protein EAXG_01565 [Escherichia coli TA054]|uniref:hypothetical protein n=1 Tax=Escherichia coli TaxID=562 RepID=UPI000A183533|nr:hypothetical protein [Escherichia coli]OSL75032.1 hypothetical protein EAXG_01565 [Escherichia coli TA054]